MSVSTRFFTSATNKLPAETSREWGRPIAMDAEVKKRVDTLMQQLGL